MSTDIDILRVRSVMGRDWWSPPRPFGPNGWELCTPGGSSVIVTCDTFSDGNEWVHASIAHRDEVPNYAELKQLHHAVWNGQGWAYQVFAPDTDHVNEHPHALHLWGRLDGSNPLPTFPEEGHI